MGESDYYEEYNVRDPGEPDGTGGGDGPALVDDNDGTWSPALIQSEEDAVASVDLARRMGLRVVMASGGFDPIHPGHVGYLRWAAEEADRLEGILVVVVNGDGFLTRKKGRPFMRLADRCAVVAALRGVDLVLPFEDEGQTVDRALELLRPDVFAKGGDRSSPETIPEWATCQRLGIRVMTDVGPGKRWSSSELVTRASHESAFAASPEEMGRAAVHGPVSAGCTCPFCPWRRTT